MNFLVSGGDRHVYLYPRFHGIVVIVAQRVSTHSGTMIDPAK
jgi:hypothetical protein